MGTIKNVILWIKLKWALRGTGVTAEVTEYTPTPNERLLNDARDLFFKVLEKKATLEERVRANDEYEFLIRAKENLADFVKGERNPVELELDLDIAIDTAEEALGRPFTTKYRN